MLPPQGMPDQNSLGLNGSAAPGMPMPIPPPIPPDVLEKAQRIIGCPSWEDISAILRSKDRRNYKINVSTDAMEEEDDVEHQEQILSFGTTVIEMMEKILPAAAQNPSLAPFARELVMAVVKEFKAGRPLEEALEDGLNQIQNNPQPQQPNPEMIKAQAEIKKAETEAQVAQLRMQLEQQKVQAQIANDQANRQLDVAKHQQEGQLKVTDMQLQHQQKMAALENARLNTMLELKKLGISTRKQALEEWEASGEGIQRQADIESQQRQDAMQAHDQTMDHALRHHDQTNKHAIEHRKIDAQREAAAQQAAAAAQQGAE